jgi:hypothetical protein
MNPTPEGFRTVKAVLLGKKKAQGSWPLKNFNPFNL